MPATNRMTIRTVELIISPGMLGKSDEMRTPGHEASKVWTSLAPHLGPIFVVSADMSTLDYTLCETNASVRLALVALRKAQIIFLDCQGSYLGRRGGQLSLISLRIQNPDDASSKHTFILDAYKFSRRTLSPIYNLLSSRNVQKVVFDGRMIYSCLYHQHNVELQNVTDLQLADIQSRAGRGENEDKQMERLQNALPIRELRNNRQLYTKIHKLSALPNCVREHGLDFMQVPNREGMCCFLCLALFFVSL